jgi:tetratricopeptide (TPR) repeat protein
MLALVPVFGVIGTVVALAWQAYRTSRPEFLFRQGQEALARRDRVAVEEWAIRLEASGQRDHALLLRGRARFQAKDFVGALATLKQVSPEGEVGEETIAFLGRCYQELGQVGEALATFAILLTRNPDSVDAHRGLAAVSYDLGDIGATLHHCRQWARLDDRDGRPFRWMALIHKDLAQHALAAATYREALGRDLKDEVREEAREELAECLLYLNQYAEVLKELEGAHPPPVLMPSDLYFRAEALHSLGRSPEALTLVTRALALKADLPGALRLRATLHLEANEPDPAIALLERAVKLAPLDYANHYSLAKAYTTLGRKKDAEAQQLLMNRAQRHLEELSRASDALMSRPRDPALHLHMAELFQAQNMTKMAARYRHTADLLGANPAAVPR